LFLNAYSGRRRAERRGAHGLIAGLGFTLLLAVAIVPAAASTGGGSGLVRPADSNVIDGSYIVVYDDAAGKAGAATDAREAELGFRSTHRYHSALSGFSAKLTAAQVSALERDPGVSFVQADRTATATAFVPRVTGEPVPPTGIRRLVAAKGNFVRQAAQDRVAVIDTGANLSHPDLNVTSGKDCVDPGTTAEDGNGHGTHVAGTIGAKNNGSGVTGVAPNTRIYAVRVLNNAGSGSFSQIICGIDWVTANAASKNIEVANMSLGGLLGSPQSPCPGTTDAMHLAICNATDANTNVTFVVAAGNDGWDFDFGPNPDVPAAYKEVLTVAALSDSDGRPGALGPKPSCRNDSFDDREAPFSNFASTAAGQAHTIAAPGVCIKSTWLAGGYNTISGTSMASPAMAGVAALCHGEVGSAAGPCQSRTPAQNIAFLRAQAENYNTANPGYGFLHDPAHTPLAGKYYGYLTRAPNPIP
jgi:subtilisin family serine protease